MTDLRICECRGELQGHEVLHVLQRILGHDGVLLCASRSHALVLPQRLLVGGPSSGLFGADDSNAGVAHGVMPGMTALPLFGSLRPCALVRLRLVENSGQRYRHASDRPPCPLPDWPKQSHYLA